MDASKGLGKQNRETTARKLFAQIQNGTIVKVRFAETLDGAILKSNGNRK